MKTFLNAFVVLTLALGLSACGGKGGVNDTGVEANGNCSSNALSDFNSTAEKANKLIQEASDAKTRGDNATMKSKLQAAHDAGKEFITKYGASFSCKNPNANQTISSASRQADCDRLKRLGGF